MTGLRRVGWPLKGKIVSKWGVGKAMHQEKEIGWAFWLQGAAREGVWGCWFIPKPAPGRSCLGEFAQHPAQRSLGCDRVLLCSAVTHTVTISAATDMSGPNWLVEQQRQCKRGYFREVVSTRKMCGMRGRSPSPELWVTGRCQGRAQAEK